LLLADAQPLFRGKAVDATLEIEQGVDTPDRAIAAAAGARPSHGRPRPSPVVGGTKRID
jgi:hypothetical protein